MSLDERKIIILVTIIKNYLETGEPVGSRTISKFSGLNLSSATIRNEMSDLEYMGYIVQPHTSAGRIPSDKGYRFYVDLLMQNQQTELEEVKSKLFKKVDKLETILKNMANTLAMDTNYAAVASGPPIHENKIKFIQVSLVDAGKLLLVLMLRGNVVKTTVIDTDDRLDYNGVLALNLILNNALAGLSINEINKDVCEEIFNASPYHSTIESVLKVLYKTLSLEHGELSIYTSGATNIFRYPEFTQTDNALKLISVFEHKDKLESLIKDINSDEGKSSKPIKVYIGEESPLDIVTDCSIVTANYELGGGLRGTLGVIGPRRMDYEKVLEIMKQLMLQFENSYRYNNGNGG